ncbi:MAG: hypothetical protein Ct9H300mP16_06850 [Pseudomonadota bacterium]|nr:MAG: hypothetical protein Ct9H300mP16_06850 [Pseudomonadota bacterium]
MHAFHDMHILGDMLLSAGFAEPVVDSEILTLTYNSLVLSLLTLGPRADATPLLRVVVR